MRECSCTSTGDAGITLVLIVAARQPVSSTDYRKREQLLRLAANAPSLCPCIRQSEDEARDGGQDVQDIAID